MNNGSCQHDCGCYNWQTNARKTNIYRRSKPPTIHLNFHYSINGDRAPYLCMTRTSFPKKRKRRLRLLMAPNAAKSHQKHRWCRVYRYRDEWRAVFPTPDSLVAWITFLIWLMIKWMIQAVGTEAACTDTTVYSHYFAKSNHGLDHSELLVCSVSLIGEDQASLMDQHQ